MRARWVVLGVMMAGAAGYVSAEPAATGLAGLDDKLSSTGRVGTYEPQSSSSIVPSVAAPTAELDRAPRALQPTEHANLGDEVDRRGGLVEEEIAPTDAPVTACRVEVARRRQVSPGKLAATKVVLRFTVEADGRVRNAEAISAPGTDLEIAACAKRVLSEWLFAKHTGDAITVERTYHFR